MARGGTETGRYFEHPRLIEQHRKMFWRMWRSIAKGGKDPERKEIWKMVLGKRGAINNSRYTPKVKPA